MGVVHPKVMDKIDKKGAAVAVELDMGLLSQFKITLPAFHEPSRFPSISSDLSFIVPSDMRYQRFADMIRETRPEHLESVQLIDVYQDPAWKDRKSVTIRFTFTSMERTLEAQEVASAMEQLVKAGEKIGAEVKQA